MEPLAVEGDDARRLLPAMLQGVEPQRGDRGGVGVSENAEHAAFLAQPIVVEVESAAAAGRFWRRRTGNLDVVRVGGGCSAAAVHRGDQGLSGVGTIAGGAGPASARPC